MLGATWPALYANIAYAGASIIIASLTVPARGALGLSGAFIISTAIQCVILVYLFNRTLAHVDARLYLFLAIAAAILIPVVSIVSLALKVLVGLATVAICWHFCCRPVAATLGMRFSAAFVSAGA